MKVTNDAQYVNPFIRFILFDMLPISSNNRAERLSHVAKCQVFYNTFICCQFSYHRAESLSHVAVLSQVFYDLYRLIAS